MTALPQLELSDHHRSPFDEAVLIIGGKEEHTITIECEGALDLADRLIRYVNAHEQVLQALTAAMYALRSYEFGNAAPDLAAGVADQCESIIKQTGEAA
jgi:hypothetical protein